MARLHTMSGAKAIPEFFSMKLVFVRERHAGALTPLAFWLAAGLSTMTAGLFFILLLLVPLYLSAGGGPRGRCTRGDRYFGVVHRRDPYVTHCHHLYRWAGGPRGRTRGDRYVGVVKRRDPDVTHCHHLYRWAGLTGGFPPLLAALVLAHCNGHGLTEFFAVRASQVVGCQNGRRTWIQLSRVCRVKKNLVSSPTTTKTSRKKVTCHTRRPRLVTHRPRRRHGRR